MIDSYDEWGDKRWNEGLQQGHHEELLRCVDALMKNLQISFAEACDKMDVPSDMSESLRTELSK